MSIGVNICIPLPPTEAASAGPEHNNAEAKRYRENIIDARGCVIYENMSNPNTFVATTSVRRLRLSSVREDTTESSNFGSRIGLSPAAGTPGRYWTRKQEYMNTSNNYTPGALGLASLANYRFLA